MNKFIYGGHDLTPILCTSSNSFSFKETPKKNNIPETRSIVYTVWDSNEKFIYVGIAGTNAEFDERKPQSRIKQHSSGYRSGDQFCVYVHDFYVLPIIFAKKQYTPIKRELDKLTKDYIHNNFHYRFVDFQTKNSNIIVKKIEDDIKSGSFGIKPELNGKWEFAK